MGIAWCSVHMAKKQGVSFPSGRSENGPQHSTVAKIPSLNVIEDSHCNQLSWWRIANFLCYFWKSPIERHSACGAFSKTWKPNCFRVCKTLLIAHSCLGFFFFFNLLPQCALGSLRMSSVWKNAQEKTEERGNEVGREETRGERVPLLALCSSLPRHISVKGPGSAPAKHSTAFSEWLGNKSNPRPSTLS